MAETVIIKTHTVAGNSAGPHLLVTGGVHGDEYEPMAAIRQLIQTIEPDQLRGSVTLAPVVNEAAFARGQRTADDGLDLARTCPGNADGSITERTAHALSELIRTADLYIDLHTGGSTMSIFPLAGYVLHRESKVLETQRRMARAFNLPIVWGTSAELEGRSLSVARDAGIPAIYTEYYGPGACNPVVVEAYSTGCLNVMTEMNMLERPTPASQLWKTVEDPRPASGHLQRSNPSPADGFFEPAVSLGDAVSAGDRLGRLILDPLGNESLPIHSGETGIVLLLRICSSVRRGETVAVILETSQEGKP